MKNFKLICLTLLMIFSAGNGFAQQDSTFKIFDRFGNTYTPEQIARPTVSHNPNDYVITTTGCAASFFDLTFEDINTGFSDPAPYPGGGTLGEARRKVACQVFEDLAVLIQPTNNPSTGVPSTVKIQIQNSYNLPRNALGGASAYYTGQAQGAYIGDGLVWQVINTGTDPLVNLPFFYNGLSSNNYHGYMKINFNPDSLPVGLDYHLDILTPALSNRICLYSTILHEAIHTLGFASLIGPNGFSSFRGYFTRYDSHLFNLSDNDLLINPTNCLQVNMGATPAEIRSTCTNIKFSPFNYPIYAPSSFRPGSSLSHLDTLCGGKNNFVMQFSSDTGKTRRKPQQEEVDILCALNYSLNSTYGAISSNTLSYNNTYTSCSPTKVIGRDDFFKYGTSIRYTVKKGNTITISDVLDNDMNVVNGMITCLEIAFGDGELLNKTNTSFDYKSKSASSLFTLLQYVPVDQFGNRGTQTFIYIINLPDDSPCTPGCNLVANEGFEQYSECPTGTSGFMNRANGWYGPVAHSTPDYFNTCRAGVIPTNVGGSQYPRTGNAMAGIFDGEFIQTKLCQTLIAGKTYKVKFYVSLGELYPRPDTVGVFFHNSPLLSFNTTNLPGFKHHVYGANISDMQEWTLIENNYIANGGENYITFGLSHTQGAYYYIDDVSVTEVPPVITVASVTPCFTTLQVPSEPGETYQWKLNGTDIASATNSTYPANVSGSYTAVITDPTTGCAMETLPFNFTYTTGCGLCSRVYADTLGNTGPDPSGFGQIIDAGGGTINYTGNYYVQGDITLKNGTFKLNPGTFFYVKPNVAIYVDNAVLDLNSATITAGCDTAWEGILPVQTNATINMLNSELSGAHEAIQDGKTNSCYLNIKNSRFKNNRIGISLPFNMYPGIVYKNSFTFDPANTLVFNNSVPSSANRQGILSSFVTVKGNTFSNATFGLSYFVFNTATLDSNFFNANKLGIDVGSGNHIILTRNVLNIPSGGTGIVVIPNFRASNNKFIGDGAANETGLVHSIIADNGLEISNNTFQSLSTGINNLNFSYQGALIRDNIFNSVINSVYIDNNNAGLPPIAHIRCNEFTKGTASLPTGVAAIRIASGGQLGQIGSCAIINPRAAGNKYTGYGTAPDWSIDNQSSSTDLFYYRSIQEALPGNMGRTSLAPKVTLRGPCLSGCALMAELNLVTVTIAQLQAAVNQLRRILPPLVPDLQNVRTVIAYYRNNCSPEYQNIVNQMLPVNLYAYNMLAWNLTECYIQQNSIPLALSLITEIEYNNPGNIAIQQRSNYYKVYLKVTGQSTYIGYQANAQDMQVLADVMASGTDFSAIACYLLAIIDPLGNISNCVSFGGPSALREGVIEKENDNSGITFSSAPNPFSESTKIMYSIPETVKQAFLKVYDIQGRIIQNLSLDIHSQEVVISAAEMEDGIYLYSIETDGILTIKKKLVVIK